MHVRILAISGSLRTSSTNTTLLQAAAKVAPAGIAITLYDRLADLPHFSPDLDGNEPSVVLDFRHQLQSSDAVFISTPEYAHGVPGVLKNALDWLVGSLELTGKPVALLNASARSTYAQTSLQETLTIMSARLIPEACVTLPLLGKNADVATIVADHEMSKVLRHAISAMISALDRPAASPNTPQAVSNKYVDPTEQLVTEIVVRDIRTSLAFYRSLGFELLRDAGDFVELTWEEHRLFLAELSAFHGVESPSLAGRPSFPPANVRVMVQNVDELWKRANEIGAKVVIPIDDRYYGLRDFTIADPDGFGIRFATLLE
jgi:NAD(P)H-dependent FMN reductase/catechol 2,3-dioxygenase-like lactoylglutathione lyase family enzyme